MDDAVLRGDEDRSKVPSGDVRPFRRCCRGFGFTVALALLFTGTFGTAPAAAKYASLVMDFDSGRILHATNADTRNYPASLTKMMTMYMVFDALETGTWKLRTRLKVSRRAARQPASRLGLRAGKSITVRDAVLALVTRSANDAATVIAENMAGSERAFALHMTAKARKLGMNRTTFRNASGLPHRGQMSTARDMARLARALIRDHAKHYHFFSTRKFSYGGRIHSNHNALLATYNGADGIKTGYIQASGYNLVASAKRGGNRLIGVVFGGDSSKQRNRHMIRLLDKGFRAVRGKVVVAKSNQPAAKPAPSGVRTAAKPSPRRQLWGIQVGAFSRPAQAYEVARAAVDLAPSLLRTGKIKVVPLRKKSGRVLHRARIHGITKRQAYLACGYLKKRKRHCMELRIDKGVRVAAR